MKEKVLLANAKGGVPLASDQSPKKDLSFWLW
jgi:hypothetical protein